MSIYRLYVKTHKITGLKYLGQTKQDPYLYPGSGIDWKIHLRKFGNNVSTEIIKECLTKDELRSWGIYYSNLWSIVESSDWANRIPESGSGAGRVTGTKMSEKSKALMSLRATGRIRTVEQKEKQSIKMKERFASVDQWNKGIQYQLSKKEKQLKYGMYGENNPSYGKPVPTIVCPHCDKTIDVRNYARYHGDNCRIGT